MKKLHLLKTMLLLCALIVGSSSVWAEDRTITITISSFTGLPATQTYGTYNWAADGISGKGTIFGGTSATNMQMNGSNRVIYSTTAIPGNIKSVKLTKASVDGSSNRSFQVFGRTSAYNGTDDNKGTQIGPDQNVDEKGKTYTVETGSYNYFVVYLNASKAAYLSSIVVTYEEESASAETTSITIDDSGITNTDVYTSTDAGSLSAVVKDKSDNEIDGAVVTWSSSTPSVATIDENTGEITLVRKGITTITANYSGVSGTYKASSQNYVLNVTSSNPVVTIDLSNTLFGISVGNNGVEQTTTVDGITITTGCSSSASTKTSYQSNHIRFYTDSYLTLTAPTGYVITGVQLNRYSDDTWNGDKVTPSEGSFAEAKAGTAPLVWSGNVSEVTFSYAGQCRTASVEVTLMATVCVTDAKYATYYTTRALNFGSTGITVYTAKNNATSVTLNVVAGGQVPANTPVVLYKEDADGTPINVPLIASADPVGSNDLSVVGAGGLSGEDGVYVLAKKSNGVGFYLWDKSVTLNEGKVCLRTGASSAREFLSFDQGETTGINAALMNNERMNNEVYNLNGQRVAQPTKGLYIVNGRKVVIK